MVYRLINFFLLIQFVLGLTEGDYIHGPKDVHTSTYLLQNLVKKELAMAQILNDFVNMVENHSKQLRRYRKKYHSVVNKEKDISKFVAYTAMGVSSSEFKTIEVKRKLITTMNDPVNQTKLHV